MEDRYTIKNLTERVETASTEFEMNNTELKRKYLIWNISIFNKLASKVSVSKGTFGTGYPFYALDENLQGKLPIIQEQIRYNRQLVRDGRPIQKSIWLCKNCLEKEYSNMPDLKKICKPCPNMLDKLKPRKIINRLPDIDMYNEIVKIGNKLIVTHIHDNYGTDSHNQPFDGTINWDDVRKALTDINYNGELTSEVRYSKEELSDSSNINKTYDLIKKIHLGY